MPSDTTSSERIRVLLVDDNEAMLTRAKAVLASSCEVVGVVKDGSTALAATRTLRPEVIVLDISMEGMNGLQVADCLRKTGSTAAVVFLTVHDEEDVICAAQGAGALGYVIKARLAFDLKMAVREARQGRSFTSPIG